MVSYLRHIRVLRTQSKILTGTLKSWINETVSKCLHPNAYCDVFRWRGWYLGLVLKYNSWANNPALIWNYSLPQITILSDPHLLPAIVLEEKMFLELGIFPPSYQSLIFNSMVFNLACLHTVCWYIPKIVRKTVNMSENLWITVVNKSGLNR